MSDVIVPRASKSIVLRDDFDDWAILFDPESGRVYGVNPVSVYVWKRLDGKRTEKKILEELREKFDGIPKDAENHIRDFISELVDLGFAGYETENSQVK